MVAGIGGGAITIPLLIYFFGMSLKHSTAISSFSILIATIAKFLTSYNEKNPDKLNCVSIDYGITNIMMPVTLIGSVVGAYIYVAFPDMILEIAVTIILLILSIDSLKHAVKITKKEYFTKDSKILFEKSPFKT